MEFWERIYRGLCFFEEKGTVFVCVLMTAAITVQVFCRYILNLPLTWSQELGKFCLVWLTFLGGSYVLRRKKHISINIIMSRTSEKVQRITALFINILALIVLGVVIYESIPFMKMMSKVPSVTMGFSMGLVYGALPLAFFFMIIHLMRDIAQMVNQLRR